MILSVLQRFLLQNTEYKGVYYADHEAIRCFWDVFFEFSLDQKKKFLQFLMGTTRIPLQVILLIILTPVTRLDS